MSPQPISQLLDALRDLGLISTKLRAQSAGAEERFSAPLSKLASTIQRLDVAKAAKPVHCPEEYLREWNDFVSGRRSQMEARLIRFLCWQPNVVMQLRFHQYLKDGSLDLGSRSLQGLVRSCHRLWSVDKATLEVIRDIQRRIVNYQGPNRVVQQWRDNIEMILDSSAITAFAAWMKKEKKKPKAAAESWQLEEDTPFFVRSMSALMDLHRRASGESFSVDTLVDGLMWQHWPLADFKAEVAKTFVCRDIDRNHEVLLKFVMSDSRLGDPRLPANQVKWAGVAVDAKRKAIKWLSQGDIIFFFDHAFPKGKDPHGRKKFWLDYASSITLSRPLMGKEDLARLRSHQRRNASPPIEMIVCSHCGQKNRLVQAGQTGTPICGNKDCRRPLSSASSILPQNELGNFGEMAGDNSAFVLHFGDIFAIEFSRVGACYVYRGRDERDIIPDLWKGTPFTDAELKDKAACVERIPHIGPWEDKLAGVLARYGIRRERSYRW